MSANSLEQRVAFLEERITRLEIRLAELIHIARTTPANDWRSVVGMFADDPLAADVLADIQRLREEDRAAKRIGPQDQLE